ncbi:MAG: hypothetical protein LBM02_09695 [Lachnospiraceae bacterium]|nr:hypothetical protein [Lachnospiraceae bacterium]
MSRIVVTLKFEYDTEEDVSSWCEAEDENDEIITTIDTIEKAEAVAQWEIFNKSQILNFKSKIKIHSSYAKLGLQ